MINSVDELKEKYPDIYNSIVNSTAEAEKNRLSAIDAIAGNIDPKLVNEAKKNGGTAETLALKALQEQAKSGKAFFENMVDDSQESGADGVEGSETPPPIEDKPQTLANKGQSILNKIYSGGVK